jgi:HK97 family phage major capsid protein
MALYTSTTGADALLPQDTSQLVILPTLAASVFARVTTTKVTNRHTYHIPRVLTDPTASWVAEGAEVPVTDGSLDEVVVTPTKIAALTICSSEMVSDADPDVANVLGNAIARDLAKRLDQAAFAGLAAPAAPGLTTLSGLQTLVSATAFQSLDFAAECMSKLEVVGATCTAFVTTPAVALLLAKLKVASGNLQPLLGPDVTSPTSRTVQGVPLYVSEFVAANTLWALDGSRTWTVIRSDASIESDRSVLFTSDRVALRGILRAGIGFSHPASVVKVTLS